MATSKASDESSSSRTHLSETAAGFFLSTSAVPPPIPSVPPPVIPNSQPSQLFGTTTSTERHWSNSISNMSAKVETTVRQWSTPVQKVVEGQPPRPEDNPTTITGEARRSDIRTVTPSYKYGTEKPSYEIKFGSSTNLPEAVGDYKVKETQDHFKLQIIDPKVTSNANMPVSSQTIPAAYRRNVDFPSEHSKRSFLKLEPMEQRKIRSVETRPITTSAYLTESLDRHREMEASRLREYLKAKESDANKPWNKPDWPGPKARQDNEQSIRELEEIKKTIETLQRRTALRAYSMGNLTPAQYDEAGAEVSYIKPELPCASKDYHVSGLIAKAQIREYLSGTENSERQRNETQRVHSIDIANTCKNVDASVVMSKMAEGYTSMFDLTIVPAQSNVVLPEGEESHSGAEEHLSKQFRKELHLSQNAERRTPSSSVPSASTVEDQGSRSLAQTRSQQIFSFENGESRVPSTFKRTTPEAAQLSYVVGGTQTAFAEDVSSERSQQRQSLAPVTITANTAVPSRSSPLSESVQASSTASEHFNATPRGSYRKEIERQSSTHVRPSSEPIDAGALPRSILKQSTSVVSQDEYSANDLIDRRTAQDRCCEEVSQQIPHMPDVSSPSQGPHIAQFEAMHADRNTPFEMQSEEERFRIMQENLRRHRQRSLTPQHRYPQTSFNGPFFKLEEVSISQRPRSQSVAPLLSVQQPSDEERRYSPQEVSSQRGTSTQGYRLHSSYEQQNLERYNNLKMMSASEAELTQNDRLIEEENDDSPNVIYWPPPKERRRPASAMAKSITDPERIDEYRRQKQMELKAMKRREEEAMRYHQKQMNAMEMQQQRFYEQGGAGFMMGRGQSTQTMRSLSPSTDLQQGGTNHRSASIDTQELELLTTPQQMRVFETRPISVMSESVDSRDFLFSPSVSTWKRTYIVDATQPVAKNEILTSEELLEKERFDVDLLKRREAFIEKPQPKPEIFRTGKRWQPPPEQPYIWPTMRRPLSVQPGCEPVIDFAPGVPKYLDEVEYRWEPYVYSPGYKLERKNFTPTNSPPLSPIRGMGTGPLDEVAKRQTRYLITPSPDGSHRPKPAFGGPRATPSGGFYPHAPNAIKIVKKKLLHAARTPSPIVGEGDVDDVEVIHERNYHLLGDSASPSRSPERISRAHNERIAPSSSHRSTHYTRGRQPNVADWEKIYDLPPHSSTVTIKDVPPNVDVKRRLAQFEGVMPYFDTAHRSKIGRDEDARSKVSSDRRLGSPTAQQRYQDAERRRTPLQRQPRHNFVTEPKEQRYRSEARTTLLRRFNAPATAVHVDTTVDQAQRSNTTSSRRKHNNTPTSIQQQEQHPQTAVQRRLQRQTTTPSPSAPSYERAHVYGPPALPSGHRRTPSPVTGYHTRNSTPSTSRERTERTVHVSRSANATPQQFAVPVRGSTEFAMMGSTRSIPFSGSTLETPISPRGDRIF